jgi:hypothetical protein
MLPLFPEQERVLVHHLAVIFDDGEQRWACDAEVAETVFTGRHLNLAGTTRGGQGELFAANRYRAVFSLTVSPRATTRSTRGNAGHAGSTSAPRPTPPRPKINCRRRNGRAVDPRSGGAHRGRGRGIFAPAPTVDLSLDKENCMHIRCRATGDAAAGRGEVVPFPRAENF